MRRIGSHWANAPISILFLFQFRHMRRFGAIVVGAFAMRTRNVAGAPETNWPAGAYVTRRGCFKDFNSAHFVYRFLIRRILFSSSRSAEMLFWEIYFIYTLEGKEISKTLNIGQEFMKKIYFANTQPLLMTFTLLRLYHLC